MWWFLAFVGVFFGCFVLFARATVLIWQFDRRIRRECPVMASRYGMSLHWPPGSTGPALLAIYSKVPCEDPRLEASRNRTRRAATGAMFSLIVLSLFVLGFGIASYISARLDLQSQPMDTSLKDCIWLCAGACVFMFIVAAHALVIRRLIARADEADKTREGNKGVGGK
jgi:hypothetical protein